MPSPAVEHHRRRRFSGRDPFEEHRASTPLELLYDLTIVVAFGTAADELADYVAEGHAGLGVAGFAFGAFAVQLGVAELLVVRVGLRHRRLAVPPGDDGPDDRGRHPLARPAADVRVDRSRRHARQPRGGRRLRDHAHGARVPVVAGVPARSRAPADRALLHAPGRASPRSPGWRSPSRTSRVGTTFIGGRRPWSRSSSPSRSSPSARAGRRGTPTTSPSATACW